MNKFVNAEMITLAREIRSFTQKELSERSGISQGRISRYEGGVATVLEEDLEKLSRALRFPIGFFSSSGQLFGLEASEVFHRKRRSLSSRQRKRIDGLMNMHRIGATRLLDAFDQITELTVPSLSLDEFEDVSEIAAIVRASWKMPSGPVNNMVRLLEQASCLVFSYDFGSDKIDEAVQWIDPSPPIIMVNSSAPADRVRFSLAHALGHLVMHRHRIPYQEMETEANEFAGEFLMPEQDVIHELYPVTIQHMLELKQTWKVSMQALIYRARELGLISSRNLTSLYQQLSRLGYRMNEPFPIARENPTLVKILLDSHKEQLDYNDTDLARLLNVTLDDYYKWYYPSSNILSFPSQLSQRTIMNTQKKPGEKPSKSGEYMERGPRDGNVKNPRIVSIDRGDRLPPTREPGRTWKRIGPRKPDR